MAVAGEIEGSAPSTESQIGEEEQSDGGDCKECQAWGLRFCHHLTHQHGIKAFDGVITQEL